MRGESVYTMRPEDPEAFCFDAAAYGVRADGQCDVTRALQQAVNRVKREKNFGILFLPEGKYRLSAPIYIPASVRLIGYGEHRPELILGAETPGYQTGINYMVWFTSAIVEEEGKVSDANPGTFYSGISNIDFRIGRGNPGAAAIRSRYAQHCFISHSDIHIGEGYAGIHHVGNEIEDVSFYGGEYGIVSSRTSPGWPMMMIDTRFEGQRKAAICSREAGFTIVNMHVSGVPVVFEMEEGVQDRLYIEDSVFEDISRCGIVISLENSTFSQVNLQNVRCRNVPVLATWRQSGKQVNVQERMYRVREFVYGLTYDDLESRSDFAEHLQTEKLVSWNEVFRRTIPALPAMEEWVSVRDYGAVGDGVTDDTEAFRRALSEHETVYVPQGWYRLTSTLKMREHTRLIGLHPFGTQLIVRDGEPAFSGFGTPVPVVESSEGGDNQLNGIGIHTGVFNYRAVGCKWMAGKDSYVNDVKFVGGHGTLDRPDPADSLKQASILRGDQNLASRTEAWNNQHWSLWITNGGGGTFKDIWTADPYAASGLRISDTDTPGRVYAMSLEHHVRTETTMSRVSNWKFYAFQFEEEEKEGVDCIMAELSECRNLEFVNVWMYRSVRASTPKKVGINVWDCRDLTFRNMHNYTQALPVIQFPVYDVNRNLAASSWDFAFLRIRGEESGRRPLPDELYRPVKLADGFIIATGATTDREGNVYFCETKLRKIYKWSAATGRITMIGDYPWRPYTLATDTKGRLLVVARYYPQPGYLRNGVEETARRLPDDNPMYSGWGNGGYVPVVYSMDPEQADATLEPLILRAHPDLSACSSIIYPSSRWRDDFDAITTGVSGQVFLTDDGATAVPETFDLCRSCAVFSVEPGQKQPVYVVNEKLRSTMRFSVGPTGRLSESGLFAPRGQYCSIADSDGNVYVSDGEIFVYDPSGREKARISLDERPVSIALGGRNREYLLATSDTSVYLVKIK